MQMYKSLGSLFKFAEYSHPKEPWVISASGGSVVAAERYRHYRAATTFAC
jgi:hypothetical protein